MSPPVAPVSTSHQREPRPTATRIDDVRRASRPSAPADPATPTGGGRTTPNPTADPAPSPTADPAPSPTADPAPSPTADPVAVPAALPSRRSLRTLRSQRTTTRPTDLGRAATRALAGPLRAFGSAFSSAKAVPLTATAVVACLFVTVATPQTAQASTPSGLSPALSLARDAQHFTATGAPAIPVERDAFGIGESSGRPASGAARSTATAADPDAPAVRPVVGTIPAAGGFGSRWVSGCAACSTNHQGLDFAAPTGTAVVAAMSGRVESAGPSGGYGNQILLRHADGSQTRYGHLSRIGIRVGQTVAGGELIGAVGSTGVSTGSHLHFEVIVGGTPVDPAQWLRDRGLL